jgi:hypothetical protein
MVVQAYVEGQPTATVPVRISLDPAIAHELALQMRAVTAKRIIAGTMKIWPLIALLVAGVCIGSNQTSLAEPVTIDLTHWTPPDIGTVGDDPFGNLVKYGYALFTNTPNEIGPGVSDTAKRFAGNNLACQNCHLQAGTQPYAMPCPASGANFHNTVRVRARWTYSRNELTVA